MATCEFFYDFSSPFSYLAATQIERVCRGHRLVWRPFFLGALFKAIGTPTGPISTFTRNKQLLAMKEQLRWAEHWGVPFEFPEVFPQKTLTALRTVLQLPEELIPPVSLGFFRVMWVENGLLEDKAALERVLAANGLDAGALFAGTESADVKARLRQNTEEAAARGVCGAPSFLVGDTVFWGQDRLHFVEKALAGWVPARDKDAEGLLPRIPPPEAA